ncbi:hypothetical protein HK405_010750, partial [Cladochytrium tenue]
MGGDPADITSRPGQPASSASRLLARGLAAAAAAVAASATTCCAGDQPRRGCRGELHAGTEAGDGCDAEIPLIELAAVATTSGPTLAGHAVQPRVVARATWPATSDRVVTAAEVQDDNDTPIGLLALTESFMSYDPTSPSSLPPPPSSQRPAFEEPLFRVLECGPTTLCIFVKDTDMDDDDGGDVSANTLEALPSSPLRLAVCVRARPIASPQTAQAVRCVLGPLAVALAAAVCEADRRHEARLRAAAWRSLVLGLAAPALLCRPEGAALLATPGWECIAGDRWRAGGAWVTNIHPEDERNVEICMHDSCESLQVLEASARVKDPAGAWRPVAAKFVPVDAQSCWLVVHPSQQAAADGPLAPGLLIHELKAPLAATVSLCDLALQSPMDVQPAECFRQIRRTADAGLRFVGDTLTRRREEAGWQFTSACEFSPMGELEEILDELRALAGQSFTELSFGLGESLPATVVGAKQVFRHSLLNSRAFSDTLMALGSKRVEEFENVAELQRAKEAESSTVVCCNFGSASATVSGIRELLQHCTEFRAVQIILIFAYPWDRDAIQGSQAWLELSQSTSRRHQSLRIVHKPVRMSGFYEQLHHDPKHAALPPSEEIVDPNSGVADHHTEVAGVRGPTSFVVSVLAVDDNPVFLKVLTRMLSSLGLAVTEAGSRTQALKIVHAEHDRTFDLLVVDNVM